MRSTFDSHKLLAGCSFIPKRIDPTEQTSRRRTRLALPELIQGLGHPREIVYTRPPRLSSWGGGLGDFDARRRQWCARDSRLYTAEKFRLRAKRGSADWLATFAGMPAEEHANRLNLGTPIAIPTRIPLFEQWTMPLFEKPSRYR